MFNKLNDTDLIFSVGLAFCAGGKCNAASEGEGEG
jgi:hypothetical protein